MYDMIEMFTEVKRDGKNWEKTFCTLIAERVYERLAKDLVAKKLHGCTYIRSIKRTQLYNGYEKIVVNYCNDCRNTYIIESH